MGIGVPATRAAVAEALDRLRVFFAERKTRPGVLARRLLGTSTRGDVSLADHLVRERRVATRMDGSINADLMRTAWAAWELMDLGHDAQSAGTVRLVGYLLAQHGVGRGVGALGTGPAAPGFQTAPNGQIAPLTFPNGWSIRAEAEARFAVGCLALRVVLRAGHEGRPVIRAHLEALREWEALWGLTAGRQPQDLAAVALAALTLAPPELRDDIDRRVAVLAGRQAADGGWSDADLFNVLDALLAAGTPMAAAAINRAVPALIARQAPGGGFDAEGHEERALIALRALRRAA